MFDSTTTTFVFQGDACTKKNLKKSGMPEKLGTSHKFSGFPGLLFTNKMKISIEFAETLILRHSHLSDRRSFTFSGERHWNKIHNDAKVVIECRTKGFPVSMEHVASNFE